MSDDAPLRSDSEPPAIPLEYATPTDFQPAYAKPHSVDCCGIRISSVGLAAVQDDWIIAVAPRKGIREIVLRRGMQSEFVKVKLIALIALGLLGVFILTALAWDGVESAWLMVAIGIPLLICEVLLALGALKKGYYLEIHWPRSSAKLALTGPNAESDLQRLIQIAQYDFGYTIRRASEGLTKDSHGVGENPTNQ